MAAAGGLGGLALWGRKRFRTFVEWRKRRTARRKAVRELPPGTIAALFAAIDVSYQGPFEAMARLGLSFSQESEV